MAEIADLYVMLRANTKGFTAALAGASAEAEGFSGRIERGMKGVAAFGVLGTAALIGVGVAAVKMGSEFQANIQRVSTLAMGGKGNIKQLENGVLSLAGSVGYSPNSLSEALYHIESNFYSVGLGGKQAFQALKVAAEGAQIGGADLVDTTNALGAAVASGIPGVQNYSQAMQKLLRVVGSGDMTMQNLADALGTGVLAVVKQYGLTLTDTGAALATFGDNNIRGQKAATDLRMAVMDLTKQAKPGMAALAGIGIKAGELGAKMRSGGLLAALTDLRDHLIAAKVPANEWGAVMENAFTKKASAPMAILLGQFDRLKSKYKVLDSGADNFGQAWKERLSTVQQQVDNLKAKFEAWLTELGLKLLPMATKALSGINKGLDWLSKHQTVLKTIGVAAGTVLAVGLTMAAVAAAELAADFLLVALPIAAVAAGVYLLWTRCKTFRTIVRAVAADLKVALGASLNWVSHTALPWLEKAGKTIFGWFQHTALPALHAAWSATFNAIGDVIRSFINGPVAWVKARINDFQEFWKAHGAAMTELAKRAWKVIQDVIQAEITIIISWAKTAWVNFRDFFKLTWDLVVNTLRIALHLVEDTLSMAWHFILNAIGLFADLLTGRWSKLWGDVKKLVGQALSDIRKTIVDFGSGAVTLLYQAGRDIVQGLLNGIRSLAGSVGSTLKSIAGGAVSGFKHMLGINSPSKVFADASKWIPAGIAKGITDNQGMVQDALDKVSALRGKHVTAAHRAETPAEKAKKAAEAAKKAARKRAEESLKKTHEYLQKLLNALKAREHREVVGREALSKYVTAHNGKHFTAAGKKAALAKWHALDKSDTAVLAAALANQARIDHTAHATATEKRSAASKVTTAHKQLAEMQTLLKRIDAMHGEATRYHKTVTDHIKKVESARRRRQGSRQAVEEDQLTYLAAMSAAGRLGANTPARLARVAPHHLFMGRPTGPSLHTRPHTRWHTESHVPETITTHVHVHLDGKEIAHSVQKRTVRHESRNTSNGMSRYTRR